MNSLLASVSALADLDTTDEAAVAEMTQKATWQASIIGKLDHALYLIQYLSLQSNAILADKDGYNAKVKPAVTAIQQALRTSDPTEIAAAYALNQPAILTWMVASEINLPTDSYLRQSGLLDQDRRTENARSHDLQTDDTTQRAGIKKRQKKVFSPNEQKPHSRSWSCAVVNRYITLEKSQKTFFCAFLSPAADMRITDGARNSNRWVRIWAGAMKYSCACAGCIRPRPTILR